MIEIVYDKNSANDDTKAKAGYVVPKNIRQIGNTSGSKKIYIEDYVMTYLRKISKPANTSLRGAILLGEVYKDEYGEAIFISGAVDAQNIEFDVNQIEFTDQIWSKIYGEINKYFEKLKVVGWFLSRMGFSIAVNERIEKLHRENFPGNDTVLFMMDSLECEDGFYIWNKGGLSLAKGYYIYYVRNELMQNYIISRNYGTTESKEDKTLVKDATVVRNFKEINEGVENRRKLEKKAAVSFKFLFRGVAAFALVAAGASVAGGYGRIKELENQVSYYESRQSGDSIAVSAEDEKGSGGTGRGTAGNWGSGQAAGADGQASSGTEMTETGNTDGISENDGNTESITGEAVEENAGTESKGSSGKEGTEGVPAATADDRSVVYVIEEGDTLMSISIKMYNSPAYVDRIMQANDLKENDVIYVGQKIIIPEL